MKKTQKNKKLSTQASPDSNTSSVVANAFEIQLVRMLEAKTSLVLGGDGLPAEVQTEYQVQLHESPPAGFCLVNVSCNAVLGKTAENRSSVQVVFQVVMKAKETFPKLTDEERSQIITSGCVIAWPYIRQFVHSSISAMCLPPVTLPFFHPALLQGRLQFQSQTPKKKR